jgi:NAD(P)-dependent dehydrogenase (short-subunit alcohol dehydrogenase family)
MSAGQLDQRTIDALHALEGAKKIAVVTGVTSGIGLALVRRLASEGARVVGLSRSVSWNDDVTSLVPVAIDLSDRVRRQEVFAELAEHVPRVDALINNAAECVYQTPLRLSSDAWHSLVETNVMAAIDLVKALDTRLARGAHVVNVSSVTGRFVAHARFAPYAITKAAIDRLSDALRLELADRGVKVTTMAPGLVDTPIYDKVEGFEKTRAGLKEHIRTWLSADDVADAVAWLLSRPGHVVVSELVMMPLGQAR